MGEGGAKPTPPLLVNCAHPLKLGDKDLCRVEPDLAAKPDPKGKKEDEITSNNRYFNFQKSDYKQGDKGPDKGRALDPVHPVRDQDYLKQLKAAYGLPSPEGETPKEESPGLVKAWKVGGDAGITVLDTSPDAVPGGLPGLASQRGIDHRPLREVDIEVAGEKIHAGLFADGSLWRIAPLTAPEAGQEAYAWYGVEFLGYFSDITGTKAQEIGLQLGKESREVLETEVATIRELHALTALNPGQLKGRADALDKEAKQLMTEAGAAPESDRDHAMALATQGKLLQERATFIRSEILPKLEARANAAAQIKGIGQEASRLKAEGIKLAEEARTLTATIAMLRDEGKNGEADRLEPRQQYLFLEANRKKREAESQETLALQLEEAVTMIDLKLKGLGEEIEAKEKEARAARFGTRLAKADLMIRADGKVLEGHPLWFKGGSFEALGAEVKTLREQAGVWKKEAEDLKKSAATDADRKAVEAKEKEAANALAKAAAIERYLPRFDNFVTLRDIEAANLPEPDRPTALDLAYQIDRAPPGSAAAELTRIEAINKAAAQAVRKTLKIEPTVFEKEQRPTFTLRATKPGKETNEYRFSLTEEVSEPLEFVSDNRDPTGANPTSDAAVLHKAQLAAQLMPFPTVILARQSLDRVEFKIFRVEPQFKEGIPHELEPESMRESFKQKFLTVNGPMFVYHFAVGCHDLGYDGKTVRILDREVPALDYLEDFSYGLWKQTKSGFYEAPKTFWRAKAKVVFSTEAQHRADFAKWANTRLELDPDQRPQFIRGLNKEQNLDEIDEFAPFPETSVEIVGNFEGTGSLMMFSTGRMPELMDLPKSQQAQFRAADLFPIDSMIGASADLYRVEGSTGGIYSLKAQPPDALGANIDPRWAREQIDRALATYHATRDVNYVLALAKAPELLKAAGRGIISNRAKDKQGRPIAITQEELEALSRHRMRLYMVRDVMLTILPEPWQRFAIGFERFFGGDPGLERPGQTVAEEAGRLEKITPEQADAAALVLLTELFARDYNNVSWERARAHSQFRLVNPIPIMGQLAGKMGGAAADPALAAEQTYAELLNTPEIVVFQEELRRYMDPRERTLRGMLRDFTPLLKMAQDSILARSQAQTANNQGPGTIISFFKAESAAITTARDHKLTLIAKIRETINQPEGTLTAKLTRLAAITLDLAEFERLALKAIRVGDLMTGSMLGSAAGDAHLAIHELGGLIAKNIPDEITLADGRKLTRAALTERLKKVAAPQISAKQREDLLTSIIADLDIIMAAGREGHLAPLTAGVEVATPTAELAGGADFVSTTLVTWEKRAIDEKRLAAIINSDMDSDPMVQAAAQLLDHAAASGEVQHLYFAYQGLDVALMDAYEVVKDKVIGRVRAAGAAEFADDLDDPEDFVRIVSHPKTGQKVLEIFLAVLAEQAAPAANNPKAVAARQTLDDFLHKASDGPQGTLTVEDPKELREAVTVHRLGREMLARLMRGAGGEQRKNIVQALYRRGVKIPEDFDIHDYGSAKDKLNLLVAEMTPGFLELEGLYTFIGINTALLRFVPPGFLKTMLGHVSQHYPFLFQMFNELTQGAMASAMAQESHRATEAEDMNLTEAYQAVGLGAYGLIPKIPLKIPEWIPGIGGADLAEYGTGEGEGLRQALTDLSNHLFWYGTPYDLMLYVPIVTLGMGIRYAQGTWANPRWLWAAQQRIGMGGLQVKPRTRAAVHAMNLMLLFHAPYVDAMIQTHNYMRMRAQGATRGQAAWGVVASHLPWSRRPIGGTHQPTYFDASNVWTPEQARQVHNHFNRVRQAQHAALDAPRPLGEERGQYAREMREAARAFRGLDLTAPLHQPDISIDAQKDYARRLLEANNGGIEAARGLAESWTHDPKSHQEIKKKLGLPAHSTDAAAEALLQTLTEDSERGSQERRRLKLTDRWTAKQLDELDKGKITPEKAVKRLRRRLVGWLEIHWRNWGLTTGPAGRFGPLEGHHGLKILRPADALLQPFEKFLLGGVRTTGDQAALAQQEVARLGRVVAVHAQAAQAGGDAGAPELAKSRQALGKMRDAQKRAAEVQRPDTTTHRMRNPGNIVPVVRSGRILRDLGSIVIGSNPGTPVTKSDSYSRAVEHLYIADELHTAEGRLIEQWEAAERRKGEVKGDPKALAETTAECERLRKEVIKLERQYSNEYGHSGQVTGRPRQATVARKPHRPSDRSPKPHPQPRPELIPWATGQAVGKAAMPPGYVLVRSAPGSERAGVTNLITEASAREGFDKNLGELDRQLEKSVHAKNGKKSVATLPYGDTTKTVGEAAAELRAEIKACREQLKDGGVNFHPIHDRIARLRSNANRLGQFIANPEMAPHAQHANRAHAKLLMKHATDTSPYTVSDGRELYRGILGVDAKATRQEVELRHRQYAEHYPEGSNEREVIDRARDVLLVGSKNDPKGRYTRGLPPFSDAPLPPSTPRAPKAPVAPTPADRAAVDAAYRAASAAQPLDPSAAASIVAAAQRARTIVTGMEPSAPQGGGTGEGGPGGGVKAAGVKPVLESRPELLMSEAPAEPQLQTWSPANGKGAKPAELPEGILAGETLACLPEKPAPAPRTPAEPTVRELESSPGAVEMTSREGLRALGNTNVDKAAEPPPTAVAAEKKPALAGKVVGKAVKHGVGGVSFAVGDVFVEAAKATLTGNRTHIEAIFKDPTKLGLDTAAYTGASAVATEGFEAFVKAYPGITVGLSEEAVGLLRNNWGMIVALTVVQLAQEGTVDPIHALGTLGTTSAASISSTVMVQLMVRAGLVVKNSTVAGIVHTVLTLVALKLIDTLAPQIPAAIDGASRELAAARIRDRFVKASGDLDAAIRHPDASPEAVAQAHKEFNSATEALISLKDTSLGDLRRDYNGRLAQLKGDYARQVAEIGRNFDRLRLPPDGVDFVGFGSRGRKGVWQPMPQKEWQAMKDQALAKAKADHEQRVIQFYSGPAYGEMLGKARGQTHSRVRQFQLKREEAFFKASRAMYAELFAIPEGARPALQEKWEGRLEAMQRDWRNRWASLLKDLEREKTESGRGHELTDPVLGIALCTDDLGVGCTTFENAKWNSSAATLQPADATRPIEPVVTSPFDTLLRLKGFGPGRGPWTGPDTVHLKTTNRSTQFTGGNNVDDIFAFAAVQSDRVARAMMAKAKD